MKLEGSLDAFSLPDVFQLLISTRKTGGLHVRRADAHGVVYFSSGALCGATSDASRQVLARRLVAACEVSADLLSAAVDRAVAEPGMGAARALAELSGVDSEMLRAATLEQVVDSVFDVFRWPDGDFAFSVDEANPDDVGLIIEANEVVEQASQRLRHWESIAPHVRDLNNVLALAPTITDDAVINKDEWTLLSLLDGSRSVAAVVELVGSGEYVVVSKLAELVERGLLVSRSVLDDSETGARAIAARYAALGRAESSPSAVRVPVPAAAIERPAAAVAKATVPAAAVSAAAEQPADVQAADVQPADEQPEHDRPAEPDPADDERIDEQPSGESSDDHQHVDASEEHGDGTSDGEQPTDEASGGEQPTYESSDGEQSTGEGSDADQLTDSDQPTEEAPDAERPPAAMTWFQKAASQSHVPGLVPDDPPAGQDAAVPADDDAALPKELVAAFASDVDATNPAWPDASAPVESIAPEVEPDSGGIRVPAVAGLHAAANGPRLAAVGNAVRKEELAQDSLGDPVALVERDPGVNKSLLLRLIAGVKGL